MNQPPPVTFNSAGPNQAAALAALHNTVADHLTNLHGHGPWSSKTSEKGLLFSMRRSSVFVARINDEIVGTLHLTTRKPWAINVTYFTPAQAPLYLIAMAIAPAWQRQGIGREFLVEAARTAKNWPADALRLDAYDADAGAGPFYERCGYTEVGRATYRAAPLIYYEMLLKP